MTAYGELYAVLPRDFRRTLSGVRQYAEGALEFAERRQYVLRNERDRDSRRAGIDRLRAEVERLSLALFCHATYRRFVYGDKIVKEAVGTFNELGIPEVVIGTAVLSKSSPLYEMGGKLARHLYACIRDKKLRQLIDDNAKWHEIVNAFREAHDGVV